jgi:outer membrane protein assembly factor BamB
MARLSHRTARLVALCALLIGSATASAEDRQTDCGPAGSYRLDAAWSGERGCPTGIAVSSAIGPDIPVNIEWGMPYRWELDIGVAGPVSGIAIGGDGMIFAGLQTSLYAVKEQGDVWWHADLGATPAGSPSIGPTGTLFIGTQAGRIVAVSPNGTIKWSYQLANSATLSSSIVLGAGGKIFAADNLGNVTALVDGASAATLAWPPHTMGSAVKTTPALSRDGSTLYVSSSAGVLASISTTTGARLKTAAYAVGQATSPFVDASATVYVGANDGKLYAFDGATLARKWATALSTTGTVHTAVPVSDGHVFAFAAASATTDNAYELDHFGKIVWTSASPTSNPVSLAFVDGSNDVNFADGTKLKEYRRLGGEQPATGLHL